MKQFLKFCLLFILPVLVFLVVLEIVVGRIPNSYSYKYDYVLKNGQQIKTLSIGHSQLYDGFRPATFGASSFNLCNSEQTYTDGYYLLHELLPYMPNLKMVILPIGYYHVGKLDRNGSSNRELTERSCYYHKYMHLDYDGQVPLQYLYECLNPYKAWQKVYSYYVNHTDMVGCDSLGERGAKHISKQKFKLGSLNILRGYTVKETDSRKLCIEDDEYLIKIIETLLKKDIKIVMVSPPYYWNCGFDKVNYAQRRFPKDYMKKLCQKYPIQYLDYESDTTFVASDFFNETHLSAAGGDKFTKMLVRDIKNKP